MKTNLKKQLLLFFLVAFALPFALGILMAFGYAKGIDLSVFPASQMLYPAAGVMLAAMVTRGQDMLLPKRLFTGYLILTGLNVLLAVFSIVTPKLPWAVWSGYAAMITSVAFIVLFLIEKKEKRAAYGLRGRRWGTAAVIILLFFVLYLLRIILATAILGESQTLLQTASQPTTWIVLAAMIPNYFLVFVMFIGEEYGWRFYLQPILQKKFGMKKGVLLLGLIWGIWHLPINFFYYTSPADGIISLTNQFVTCLALGIFFGWAYLKTGNFWTVVVLHFANNNLVPIVSGNYSPDVLQGNQIAWSDVGVMLLVNAVLFMTFIFMKEYRDHTNRLPTMNERADAALAERAAEEKGHYENG